MSENQGQKKQQKRRKSKKKRKLDRGDPVYLEAGRLEHGWEFCMALTMQYGCTELENVPGTYAEASTMAVLRTAPRMPEGMTGIHGIPIYPDVMKNLSDGILTVVSIIRTPTKEVYFMVKPVDSGVSMDKILTRELPALHPSYSNNKAVSKVSSFLGTELKYDIRTVAPTSTCTPRGKKKRDALWGDSPASANHTAEALKVLTQKGWPDLASTLVTLDELRTVNQQSGYTESVPAQDCVDIAKEQLAAAAVSEPLP